MLAGLLQPQAGSIEIGGLPVRIDGPLEARRLGIGMVHQHFMLVPTLTVAESIALGLKEVRTWFPRLDRLADEIDALGARYGLAVNGRGLAEAGTAIAFISHKLNEVMAVTDRITVLRRGQVAGSLSTAETVAVSRALAGHGGAFLSIGAMLPYVLTIVVLAVSATRSGAPAAVGQPYVKGGG